MVDYMWTLIANQSHCMIFPSCLSVVKSNTCQSWNQTSLKCSELLWHFESLFKPATVKRIDVILSCSLIRSEKEYYETNKNIDTVV